MTDLQQQKFTIPEIDRLFEQGKQEIEERREQAKKCLKKEEAKKKKDSFFIGYYRQKIKDCDKKCSLYYAGMGRLADTRLFEGNYPSGIIAYLKNEFGYGIVMRGKRGFYCFILTSRFVCERNNFNRNRLNRAENSAFEQEFGNNLTILDEEAYKEFKSRILLKAIQRGD